MSSRTLTTVALLVIAALLGPQWVECAGWQASAHARMACCAAANHTCAGQRASNECCAQTEQKQQNAGSTAPIALVKPVAVPVPFAAGLTANAADIALIVRDSFEQQTLKLPHDPPYLLLGVFLL